MLSHDPSWCLLCYSNARKRSNYKGHYGYRRPVTPWSPPWWEVRNMKKPVGSGSGTAARPAAGRLFTSMSGLYDLLTDDLWDDGSERALATLLLFRDGPQWKVCLSDKATDRVAFQSGATPEEAICSLGVAIEEGRVDWRLSSGGKAKSGRARA